MATQRSIPYRDGNRRLSFDFELFRKELVSALNREGTDLGDSFIAGQPVSGAAPEGSSCSSNFGIDYLLSEILSKYDDGKPSPEKEANTWNRFELAEEMCRDTNLRLSKILGGRFSFGRHVEEIMYLAQRKIGNLLGQFTWDEASTGFDWGPGATFSLPRTQSDPIHKFQGFPETTPDNSALAMAAILHSPAWSAGLNSEGGGLLIVEGNRVITVPKNFKTDRVIAIEPRMNMYIQKGIGDMIRRRLRRVGIDLSDQSINRQLAFQASRTGELATVDLSMASDTVSRELVHTLLPVDWVEALEQCRSPIGVLPSGKRVVYQKFSSMGNGYTFELESLVFWALCSAVVEALKLSGATISVYGDDLIIPSVCFEPLSEVLEYCGFKVNEKKSFNTGLFRESCGFHAFAGCDVTPFYIRRSVKRPLDLFLLHNNLYRWCLRNQWNRGWDRSKMRSVIQLLRSSAPKAWCKPRIPDGFGDGAFVGTFDEARPTPVRWGWEGYRVKVLTEAARIVEYDTFGRLLKSLSHVDRLRSDLDYLSSPRSVSLGGSTTKRCRISNILVPQFVLTDPFTTKPPMAWELMPFSFKDTSMGTWLDSLPRPSKKLKD